MDPVKITIDGKEVVTTKGKTVIQAADEIGVSIPRYCYHPKLSIAGNCRMCMVEIEKMPKLQIACNIQVAEGMAVLTQSPKVLAVRKAVLEFLLINHPVDCPICDQAGECWLQDYYMQHDRQESRFDVGKVHDRKKTIFGPNVIFDGERCIKCTRCVLFCQEITKTDEFAVVNRGDHLTTPLIRQEGGLVPTTWDKALQAVYSGLVSAKPVAGILSGRNTNEEAYLFAKLVKKLAADSTLEVFYQERDLTEVQKILMSPDRSPNFRGAREMGVSSNGGFGSLMQKLVAGNFSAAYIVGDDLIRTAAEPEAVRAALQKLSFLVVQDTRVTETTKLAHVVLPATHFGEKEGTYTNRKGRVQKLNAAVIPLEGALQDCEIFIRLLEAAGEKLAYSTPSAVFDALAKEVPGYRGLSYAAIGLQGVQLGGGEAKQQ